MQKIIILVDIKYCLVYGKSHSFFLNLVEELSPTYEVQDLLLQALKNARLDENTVDIQDMYTQISNKLKDEVIKFKMISLNEKEKISLKLQNSTFISEQIQKFYEIEPIFSLVKQEFLDKFDPIFFYFSESSIKKVLIKQKFQNDYPEFLDQLHIQSSTQEIKDKIIIEKILKAQYWVTHRPLSFKQELSRVIYTEKLSNLSSNNLIYVSNEMIPLIHKIAYEKQLRDLPPKGEVTSLSQVPSLILNILAKNEVKSSGKIIKIGYYFIQKKYNELFAAGCLINSLPFQWVPIDLRFPLDRDIDIFIHKATDLYKTFSKQESKDKWEAFVKLSHKIENKIPILDPCDNLLIPSDRALFNKLFQEVFISKEFTQELTQYFKVSRKQQFKVVIPITNYVDPSIQLQEEIDAVLKQHTEPTIIKTKIACATKKSHNMALALNYQGLIQVIKHDFFNKEVFLLQQIIDHQQTVFKIYVIGDQLFILPKPSLPWITLEMAQKDYLLFDSQLSFQEQFDFLKNIDSPKSFDLDISVVRIITKYLSKELKLTLFGIDIIKETSNGNYHVIDINIFSRYKGVDNLPEALFQHIKNIHENFQK